MTIPCQIACECNPSNLFIVHSSQYNRIWVHAKHFEASLKSRKLVLWQYGAHALVIWFDDHTRLYFTDSTFTLRQGPSLVSVYLLYLFIYSDVFLLTLKSQHSQFLRSNSCLHHFLLLQVFKFSIGRVCFDKASTRFKSISVDQTLAWFTQILCCTTMVVPLLSGILTY